MASVWKRKCDKDRRGAPWYCSYFDAQRGKWATVKGYSDKAASEEKAIKLERESARRAEGIIDPVDEQSRRPIDEHVGDYIIKLKGEMCVPRHVLQIERRLTHLFAAMRIERIMDLDATKVLKYFTEHKVQRTSDPDRRTLSVSTRNGVIANLKAFSRWAAEARRVPFDPLATLKKIDERAQSRVHPRRAITPSDIGLLLRAAEERPLKELMLIRRGKNKGKLLAKVGERAREEAVRLGCERRMCYLIAVWAGLRRSEIEALTWGDIHLDSLVPRITLRAETTKAGRGDSLVLHHQLADELRAYRPDDWSPSDSVVQTVPDMNVMRRDLAWAGIDAGDRIRGFIDLHSLRMTLNTLMASHGMTQRSRQAQMRHSDPRLTEVTYMDQTLLPIADELGRVPAIPLGGPTLAAGGNGSERGTPERKAIEVHDVGQRGTDGAKPTDGQRDARARRRSA